MSVNALTFINSLNNRITKRLIWTGPAPQLGAGASTSFRFPDSRPCHTSQITPNLGNLRSMKVIRSQICTARAPEIDIPEMIDVPKGTFIMGSTKGDEAPTRLTTLSSYRIGKYPVTVAQFKTFVDVTGFEVDAELANIFTDKTKADHPVTHVSYDDALAYTKWLSQTTRRLLALPTEAQWERAARGADGQQYPFGKNARNLDALVRQEAVVFDKQDMEMIIYYRRLPSVETRPVNRENTNKSPSGALDMAGNVNEWIADWYAAYDPNDRNDPQGPYEGEERGIRGGSWYSSIPNCLRGASRNKIHPSVRNSGIGFRLAERI